MPYCPKCRYEYNVGVQTCPDCDETLVFALSPDDEPASPEVSVGKAGSKDRFVPLPNLPGKVYAEMVKGALEERGIPCYIHHLSGGGVMRASGTGLPATSVELFVPEDRYEECAEIQRQMVDL